MLFYSTYIMDDLVDGSGLEAGGSVELATSDLALQTGFAPVMQGPNGSASYGQLVTLGIMQGADPAAQDVIRFFLTEGYQDVLGLAPSVSILPTTRPKPWSKLPMAMTACSAGSSAPITTPPSGL
jgi:hypothetical protein